MRYPSARLATYTIAALLAVTLPAQSSNQSADQVRTLPEAYQGLVYNGKSWVEPAAATRQGHVLYRGMCVPKSGQRKLRSWLKKDSKLRPWAKRYKVKTKHYRVETNLPRALFELEVRPFLDELYKVYTNVFKKTFGLRGKGSNQKFLRIYASFPEYSKHEPKNGQPRPRTNPGFIVNGDQLVTFYDETEADTFYMTMFHEGAHQFFKGLMPGASLPIWLNEALAVYFEGCRYSRATRKIEVGFVPPKRLRLARRLLARHRSDKSGKLADRLFLNRTKANFDATHYAMSWSFLHYLIHRDDGKRSKAFSKFLKKLNGSGSRPIAEVFQRTTGEDLARLQEGWLDHVFSLPDTVAPHWVSLAVRDAGELDLRNGDFVMSIGDVQVFDSRHFQELWKARPKDAPTRLGVVRETRGSQPHEYVRKRIVVEVPAGSRLLAQAGGHRPRPFCLLD